MTPHVYAADGSSSIALRTEAMSALIGIAKNYTTSLQSSWVFVSQVVARNLQKDKQQAASPGSLPVTPSEVALQQTSFQQTLR